MNTEILSRMSLDGLRKLEAAIKTELEARLDYRVLPGRTAWFTTSKSKKVVGQVDIHCIIEQVNRTTVSVMELGDSKNSPGAKWRISPQMLRVEPVERSVPLPRARPISSRPATAATAW